MFYDSLYDFNKFSGQPFNEMPLINAKFDLLNKFYSDFVELKNFKRRNVETRKKSNCARKAINTL